MSAGTLYVTVSTSTLAHRGGTLTLLSTPLEPTIDPAHAYDGVSNQMLIVTNDGLTGFKRVGGSDGSRLVPDLAKSLPAPTDGGRTYTLQLRHGIRYSTGALVRPADFRRALERSLADTDGPGRYFFSEIVGAKACRPHRCSLTRGVVTDAAANTITFHLTAADPDFLYKLAQPSAFAVPADTALTAPQRRPLPATGPYMFTRYDAKHGIRLVRNPYFREWSAAAQPDGFPDEIVWRILDSPSAQVDDVRAVEQGQADVAFDGVPATLLHEVRTRFAGQAHGYAYLQTYYMSLNTRLPPFDDVRVRQAFSYAVDRNRLASAVSPPARISCQILPPNMFGYRRYCPYTIDRRPDGRYTGPDLAKARQLIERSGVKGQTVTVSISKSSYLSKGAGLLRVGGQEPWAQAQTEVGRERLRRRG